MQLAKPFSQIDSCSNWSQIHYFNTLQRSGYDLNVILTVRSFAFPLISCKKGFTNSNSKGAVNMFYEKVVLKNFPKLKGKGFCWIEAKKIDWEFYQILQNSFFTKTHFLCKFRRGVPWHFKSLKMWHEEIIHKLKLNGISGNLLRLLTDLLSIRKQMFLM